MDENVQLPLTQEEIAIVRDFLKRKDEIEKNIALQEEAYNKQKAAMEKIIENWKLGEETENKSIIKKETVKPQPPPVVKKEVKASEIFYGLFIKNPEEFREVVELDKYLVKGVATEKSAKKCYRENLKNEKFITLLKEKLNSK